ncbi:MAG: methylmalonyl-CoA mutase subunit beta [Flavobacteriaceae bacterium]|nr:methylmalonyl-CoA mutase subunit beta [Flavobacteriaceae bacterium]
MSKFLFSEFNEVSAKEWKQKIQADLKGVDYNDTLIWKNLEGIDVKPFYHQDDFQYNFQDISGFPKHWNIMQSIFIDDETIANQLILDVTSRGAEAVLLVSEKPFDIEIVFNNFPFKDCKIHFDFKFLSEEFISQLKDFFSGKNATVFYNIDIIGNLARSGNWFHNLKEDHSVLEAILQKKSSENILSIDTTLFQNAGATMVQQLGYGMAQANEYLNRFCDTCHSEGGTTEKSNFSSITFKISVGTNYFFEIAKIRAFRKLFALIAKEYNISTNCNIIAIPSKRNKTLYDYNVNLLRSTTEYMSAIQGGANYIVSLAYDSIYHKSNEFGERIARNQLLVLKEESYFNFSKDPSKGSYYIESLTDQLSEKALELFKNIETNSGFLSQLKEGTIQRKIKESAQKEQELFDSGKLELLGTNIHPNPNDQMKDDLELYPFVKTKPRKTLIEPIIEKRLSEKLEQERLKNEA